MGDVASNTGHWEHFAHGADIGVRGFGASRAEAFEQAALALMNVIVDMARVVAQERVAIACAAPDDELLLTDWLNALIYEMADLFEQIDVIIAPSTRGRQLLYTNMAGYPCMVVPNGDKAGGKNASICFIGRLFGEADIVQLAAAYQASTEFHRQRPPLTASLSE